MNSTGEGGRESTSGKCPAPKSLHFLGGDSLVGTVTTQHPDPREDLESRSLIWGPYTTKGTL